MKHTPLPEALRSVPSDVLEVRATFCEYMRHQLDVLHCSTELRGTLRRGDTAHTIVCVGIQIFLDGVT
jgi:hypothetical protein